MFLLLIMMKTDIVNNKYKAAAIATAFKIGTEHF